MLRPLWLLGVDRWLDSRGGSDPTLEFLGLKLRLRDLLGHGVLRYHPRVLDAWVRGRLPAVRAKFERSETVKRHHGHYPLPVVLGTASVQCLAAKHLQSVFQGPGSLVIHGEGGCGKTSLACQIARWAMSDKPDERLLRDHPMLPVLLEPGVDLAAGWLPAIRERLVVRGGEEIDDDLLTQLLLKQRVLVVVDGFSEMAPSAQEAVTSGRRPAISALIVTSRHREDASLSATEILPQPIAEAQLEPFFRECLGPADRQLSLDELKSAVERLKLMAAGRAITPLLARLFAEQAIQHADADRRGDLPKTVPGLMLAWGAIALRELGRDAVAAVPELVKVLRQSKDVECRRLAAEALGVIGGDSGEIVPELCQVLAESPPADLRQSLAAALEAFGPEASAAARALIELLDHRDPEIQWTAVTALARVEDRDRPLDRTVLDLSGVAITDLEPLAVFPHLRELDLGTTGVTDLAPLAQLRELEVLRLPYFGFVGVWDLEPLRALERLRELDLDGTDVKDLDPLRGLDQLRALSLRYSYRNLEPLRNLPRLKRLALTEVSNLEPLADLSSLEVLDLGSSAISELTVLSGLSRLRELDLGNTAVRDLTPIGNHARLEKLNLAYTEVSDLTPLAGLGRLWHLDLRHSQLSDGDPLRHLRSLRVLRVGATGVSNLEPLEELTEIEELDLEETQVSDLTPIAGLRQLRVLNLRGAGKVSDLGPLRDLDDLRMLDLQKTGVSDLGPLRRLLRLRVLDLWRCSGVSDLGPLRGLTKIEKLDLQGCSISDLEPLRSLERLSYLDLAFTKVSDLEPLRALTGLRTLHLDNAPVTHLESLAGLSELGELGLGEAYTDLSPIQHLPIGILGISRWALEHLPPGLNGITVEPCEVDEVWEFGEDEVFQQEAQRRGIKLADGYWTGAWDNEKKSWRKLGEDTDNP